MILKDAYVSINAVDYSSLVEEVRIPIEGEQIEDTAMGDSARSYAMGFISGEWRFTLQQDFVDNGLDEKLFDILDAGVPVPIVVRPVKATVIGAGNPEYRMTGTLFSHTPLGGRVGELAKTEVVVRSNGAKPTRNII